MKNTDWRSFCTPQKVKEKMGKRRSFGAFKAFDDINSLLDMHSNASQTPLPAGKMKVLLCWRERRLFPLFIKEEKKGAKLCDS